MIRRSIAFVDSLLDAAVGVQTCWPRRWVSRFDVLAVVPQARVLWASRLGAFPRLRDALVPSGYAAPSVDRSRCRT